MVLSLQSDAALNSSSKAIKAECARACLLVSACNSTSASQRLDASPTAHNLMLVDASSTCDNDLAAVTRGALLHACNTLSCVFPL